MPRGAWMRKRLGERLLQPQWPVVVAVSFALTLPMAWHLGRSPGRWLEGAWQVSAVLVGLAVALIVFLLQAAAAQSLRTDQTYRALLGASGLVWPVALAICFLGAVAIIERFAGTDTPAAWARTYALLLFLLQLGAFAGVFARVLRLTSPERVLDVVKWTFAASMRRRVEERLRVGIANAALAKACDEKLSIGYGYWGSGLRVPPAQPGWVADVDLRLPSDIAGLGLRKKTTLTVTIGERLDDDDALARHEGDDVPDALRQAVQRRVVMRRRRRSAPDPETVVGEVLDLLRRAAASDAHDAVDQAIDLLAFCLAELPVPYRLYGLDYTSEVASGGLMLTTEDRLMRDLWQLISEAVTGGASYLARELPSLGFRVVMSGVTQRAPFLVKLGLRLWTWQLGAAARVADDGSTHAETSDRVAELARTVVRHLSARLEDDSLPLERRVWTVPFLEQLFEFETDTLRALAEVGKIDVFSAVWRRTVEWGRHWHPEHEVEELELFMPHAEAASAGAASGGWKRRVNS